LKIKFIFIIRKIELNICILKYIDKKWFATEPAPAIERKENVYFHLDDELSFNNLQAYEEYLKKK